MIDWSMSGFIIESYGWQYAFYVVAVIVAVFVFIWYFMVYDSPSGHPKISQSERDYILGKLQKTEADKKVILVEQQIMP